jgi:hypothetical protein
MSHLQALSVEAPDSALAAADTDFSDSLSTLQLSASTFSVADLFTFENLGVLVAMCWNDSPFEHESTPQNTRPSVTLTAQLLSDLSKEALLQVLTVVVEPIVPLFPRVWRDVWRELEPGWAADIESSLGSYGAIVTAERFALHLRGHISLLRRVVRCFAGDLNLTEEEAMDLTVLVKCFAKAGRRKFDFPAIVDFFPVYVPALYDTAPIYIE